MKRIGIFYGSTTGATAEVARKIAAELGVADADLHDVADARPSDLGGYDVIILGSSTWGDGDVQDDMHDFLDGVKALSLKGVTAAVFGVGDENMSDTFCNAVGSIYDVLSQAGATMIGEFNTTGYDYNHTDADHDGKIVGLLIDESNHSDLTDARIALWTDELKSQI